MRVRTPDGIFETVREAAEYYGVTEGAVRTALSRGRPEGLGKGHSRPPGSTPFARSTPFKIAEREWPSMLQCSKETGIPYHRFTSMRPSRMKILSKDTQLNKRMKLELDIKRAIERGLKTSERSR